MFLLMNPSGETFHKSERLCSRKLITALFDEGNTFYSSSLKIVWFESPVTLPLPAQAAITVSKKTFRNAVTRNLLKRRIREAYRKNKSMLYRALLDRKKQVIFIIIYLDNEVRDYLSIEKSVREMINRFISLIRE